MTQKKITKSGNSVQIILTVLLVGAAFAIGSMWTELKLMKAGNGGNKPTAQNQAAQNGQAAEEKAVELTNDQWQEVLKNPVATVGDDNAKVTIVEFTDFQCPYCERFYTQTYGQIMKDYVETGKVKYVMRDLPLPFHQFASLAAEAARCAGDQGKYVEFHDELFKGQSEWSKADAAGKAVLTENQVTNLWSGYAVKLGLNRGDFLNCIKNGNMKEAVEADLALAAKVGAGGTPTFFINGKILIGAQPYSEFKTAIDAALGE